MAILIVLHKIYIIPDSRIFAEVIKNVHVFPVTDKQSAFIGCHPDASELILSYVVGPVRISVSLHTLYVIVVKSIILAVILPDTSVRRYPYIMVTVFIYMTDPVVLERMVFRVRAEPGHIPVITQMDESVLS